MQNPFTNRSMIKDNTSFVGRVRELDDIVPRLRTGNCVSVVGERRIGKSSLLYHLYQTGNQLLGDERWQFQFVYLDLLDPSVKTAEDFVSSVLTRLGIEFDEDKVAKKPTLWFSRALRANRQKALPILLIDEFDKIVKLPELFNEDFLETLRAVCNEGNLCIVTASKETLKDIITQGNLVSQLWNIFTHKDLKEPSKHSCPNFRASSRCGIGSSTATTVWTTRSSGTSCRTSCRLWRFN